MGIKEIFYDWGGYNDKIFYIINGIHGALYEKIMLIGTQLGYYKMFPIYFVLVLIIAGFNVSRNKNKSRDIYLACRDKWAKILTTLLIADLFSFVWVHVLKTYFHFPRPFMALPEGSVNILDSVRNSENPMASFPSGHSSFAMMMAACLWPALNLHGKIIACFYVIWVVLSRISLGVHFPADVTISLVISFAAVYVVKTIVDKIWPMIIKQ